MSIKSILVTGGAGFIGSHVVNMLQKHGYNPIALDNSCFTNQQNILNCPFIKGDVGNTIDLRNAFSKFDINAVMHFAAFTDVGESMTNPEKYYINNVASTLTLLNVMKEYEIKTFVFSSSAAIFGIPQFPFVKEDHPCDPINPYGKTKLFIERILEDYDLAYGLKSSCLRYFNAAGGDPEGRIKNFKLKETNLIPIVLKSLVDKNKAMATIFGTDYPTPDGTCVRDYIHVEDLGLAHILALQNLTQNHCSTRYNLGNGRGFSVLDVINSIIKVTGREIHIVKADRRPGDPPFLLSNSEKAHRELNWIPKYSDLDIIIAHAWQALKR